MVNENGDEILRSQEVEEITVQLTATDPVFVAEGCLPYEVHLLQNGEGWMTTEHETLADAEREYRRAVREWIKAGVDALREEAEHEALLAEEAALSVE